MKYTVNSNGFYGDFGGAYIPEMLFSNIDELKKNYLSIVKKDSFTREFNYYLKSKQSYNDLTISNNPLKLNTRLDSFCYKLKNFYHRILRKIY